MLSTFYRQRKLRHREKTKTYTSSQSYINYLSRDVNLHQLGCKMALLVCCGLVIISEIRGNPINLAIAQGGVDRE